MDVYLVRHAVADNRHPERWPTDALRPLTKEGIASFRSAARGLRRIVPEVEVVLSSPYTRAWETAVLLHEEAGWPAPERCEEIEAIRAPREALPVLEDLEDHSSAALVGHEPHLSQLASLLLCGDEDTLRLELKKGGVVALGLTHGAGPGKAFLRWSATPKLLRALDG
jgi:phosphohistidine phosphatase